MVHVFLFKTLTTLKKGRNIKLSLDSCISRASITKGSRGYVKSQSYVTFCDFVPFYRTLIIEVCSSKQNSDTEMSTSCSYWRCSKCPSLAHKHELQLRPFPPPSSLSANITVNHSQQRIILQYNNKKGDGNSERYIKRNVLNWIR
jgi:hypothetical protein